MIKVSVVCPTFNSARFIEKTLSSVVVQNRKPDELIISDDGSSDETVKIVEQFLHNHCEDIYWVILENTHHGPGAARNAGVSIATGEWVAFLDSDDLWLPNKLNEVESAIVDNPGTNFFCHDEQFINKYGRVSQLKYGRNYDSAKSLPLQMYSANMFSTSAVTCYRELLIQNNGFNERLMSAQDYELWLRLSPYIKPVFIHSVLGKYIERDGNITSGQLRKRMKNEIRIALMHHHMVPNMWFVLRLGRILLSFSKQYFLTYFSRVL
jgi:glycosyltransferase involved in cell wall biosynthesis